jgi:hypothetical protein
VGGTQVDAAMDTAMVPEFFELQIMTLFQHAWSEANHDIGYKPGSVRLDLGAERRLAFTSAQAWVPIGYSTSFSPALSIAVSAISNLIDRQTWDTDLEQSK